MFSTPTFSSTDSSPNPAERPTLLVVDDEEGPRKSLRVIFKDEFNLLLAEDGPTAVGLAEQQKIDVAVLDIRMAGMSGIEVLERLKRVDPAIEVVMMTAFETSDTIRQALRLRACDYITKPFEIGTIRDAMTSIDLTVRAGVHTGEIELRGDDISGISVNIASRIADQAGESEILTSDLTRQLMIGSNATFDDRGEFELKGVPGPWPLYAASLN